MRVDIILGLTCASLLGCAQAPAHSDSGTGGSGDAGVGVSGQQLPTSGTRIRVKYIQTADGARQAWGWYDTQLGVDCYFAQTQDAGLRCMVVSGTAALADMAEAQILVE